MMESMWRVSFMDIESTLRKVRVLPRLVHIYTDRSIFMYVSSYFNVSISVCLRCEKCALYSLPSPCTHLHRHIYVSISIYLDVYRERAAYLMMESMWLMMESMCRVSFIDIESTLRKARVRVNPTPVTRNPIYRVRDI